MPGARPGASTLRRNWAQEEPPPPPWALADEQAAAEDYPYDRRPAWLAAPEEEQARVNPDPDPDPDPNPNPNPNFNPNPNQARVNEPEAQPKRAQLVPQREEDAYFVDKRMTSGGIADAEMDDATQAS